MAMADEIKNKKEKQKKTDQKPWIPQTYNKNIKRTWCELGCSMRKTF